MKELVIISGKGGTGKTSITAALATLAGNAVLADCDVDAADLHLIFKPQVRAVNEFRCGYEAVINQELCARCGICESMCRFDAVRKKNGRFSINPTACEGCKLCVRLCPVQAISSHERLCGQWIVSNTRAGIMVHASMRPAAENSGKLVAEVRKEARRLAEENHADYLITDGPPGIGCPVIAAVTGADAALVVSEPTVAGEHDLVRVLQLLKHFQIKAMLCVNKADLNPDKTASLIRKATELGAVNVGQLPYDPVFTSAQIKGLSVVDFPESLPARSLQQIWRNISGELNPKQGMIK
jgi:MinD superfamily P-loop ATPase